MKLIVCLDEVGGMLFNKRRQSSDRMIREDILKMIGNQKLFVNYYTAKQFLEAEQEYIIIEEECLQKAECDDYVFIENISANSFSSDIDQVIVYRWERKYPADVFFDIDLQTSDWELVSLEEFVGYSHECIKKEIYKKISAL